MRFGKTLTRTMSKITQPKWFKPEPATDKPVLKLYNSLTRAKEEFIPMNPGKVTWYSCGPTVYDASHMGHARNYVSIDINRRILQNYFGYNVQFVQNVTDIDDKIIIRARQNYLFDQFVAGNPEWTPEVVSKCQAALDQFIAKNLSETVQSSGFEAWYATLNVEEEKTKNPKFPMYITSVQNGIKGISAKDYSLVKDVLVPVLDKELGYTVNDPEIFRKLPAFWEDKFDQDMAALNVEPTDVTTRVSEYVPEIVSFVEQIIANGYAYATTDGSVYFDTTNFSQKHEYAKLQPWNKGSLDLIAEGEGSLSTFETKKSPNDFALWKGSKPGEPEWESPWGKGRPGWHIECSVMASDILGESFDIHSGGIDLAFPHHDNELAQAEACFENHQWVNYFLHTGHLHIEGAKMSKSLKNFITIEEALNKYSARQLRLAFASQQWNNQLDFKEALIHEVKSTETSFNNFFKNVRALNNDYKHSLEAGKIISKKLGPLEKQLLEDMFVQKDKVHAAFCDNLSTPQVLKALTELVSKTNSYVASAGAELRIEPLLQITRFVTKILDILGFPARQDKLGWYDESSSSSSDSAEDIAMPFVKVLSNFRDEVRKMAINKAPLGEFLKLTDKIRDEDLLNLGISLDDRNEQASLVKFLSKEEKEELIQANKEMILRQQEKEAKKLEQQRLKEAKEQERREKAKVSPLEMFKTEQYSEWDEQGLPTKDKEGAEVTKSMRKKLMKQWEQQKKLHEEFFP